MLIEIKSVSGNLLFSAEAASTREALEKAVLARANLAGADLTGANLGYHPHTEYLELPVRATDEYEVLDA